MSEANDILEKYKQIAFLDKPRDVIIDGDFLIKRASRAVFKGKVGNYFLYDFFLQLFHVHRRLRNVRFIFAWSSDTIDRVKLHSYKIWHELVDEESLEQFRDMFTNAFHMLELQNSFIQEGKESRDIIASILTNNELNNPVVMSNDKMLFQFLHKCSLYSYAKPGKLYTRDHLYVNYWAIPELWPMVLAIGGFPDMSVTGIRQIDWNGAVRFLRNQMISKSMVSRVLRNIDIVMSNLKLFELPIEGTLPIKVAHHKPMSRDAFIDTCYEYEIDEFVSNRSIFQWERCLHLE